MPDRLAAQVGLLLAGLFCFTSVALAQQTTYVFQSVAFTVFSNGASCPPTCQLTGSFTVSQPLPPNINLPVDTIFGPGTFTPISFSFTNGIQTITDKNSGGGSGFAVNTDANGNIVQWNFYASNCAVQSPYICNGPAFHVFGSYFPDTDSQVGFNSSLGGANFDAHGIPTGTWSTGLVDPGPCVECEAAAGRPINLTTGDAWISKTEYSVPGLAGGLSLTRTWNSLWNQNNPPFAAGMFGIGWTSTFEERLQFIDQTHVRYWLSTGNAWMFENNCSGCAYSLTSPPNEHASLSYNNTTNLFTILFTDGTRKVFNANGYLTSIQDRNNNMTNVTYDTSNRITTVTAPGGQSLTFQYGITTDPFRLTTLAGFRRNSCLIHLCQQLAHPGNIPRRWPTQLRLRRVQQHHEHYRRPSASRGDAHLRRKQSRLDLRSRWRRRRLKRPVFEWQLNAYQLEQAI